MRGSFETFLSQLSKTNKTLDYFTDFGKIKAEHRSRTLRFGRLQSAHHL